MMSKVLAAMTVLFLTGVAVALEPPAGFGSSYDKALEQAKKENKPLYLHFTTDWCHWCRVIEKEDYADPNGQAALKDFVTASLDCTKNDKSPAENARNQALMEKLGGRGYPFIVVQAPDGTVLHTMVGYEPLPAFLADLQEAKDSFAKYNDFVEYAKKADLKGYDYNRKAMDLFDMTHQPDKAVKAAQQVLDLDPNNDKGDAAPAKYVLLGSLRSAADPNDDKKVAALQADIRKLDAANEKGVLEKMTRDQVEYELNTMKKEDRQATFQKAEATLSELGQMKNLKKPQELFFMLGILQAMQNKFDPAIASEEKALAADPNGKAAPRIKMILEQLKARKAAASQPAGQVE
jgi:thioredoxin-related protein